MKLERILIVDLETTGLDPSKDAVLEAAAVLVDVASGEVVSAAAALAKHASNAARATNGIDPALLSRLPLGWGEAHAFEVVDGLVPHASAFVAHSAAFDRSFFPTELANRLPWICTQFGIDWPRSKWGSSLVNAALAHGIAVHASHRALDDCLLLARLMRQVQDACLPGELRPNDSWSLGYHLEKGLARGVGVPRRCEVRDDAGQCRSWARTYSKSVVAPRCVDHGGSGQWVT